MKRNPFFLKSIAVIGFASAVVGCTYGKWEYLSWRHAAEFFTPIKQAADNGCPISYAKVIKVINYDQNSALIWFKGEEGNAYIARPWRSSKRHDWQLEETERNHSKYCNFDIIRSRTGGSADGYYWYN